MSSSHPRPSDRKGSFGHATERVALPLSKRYLVPDRRRLMVFAGLGAGLVALAFVWLDVAWDGGEALSGGPLSSAHATLEASCASCHGGAFHRFGEPVADAACAACHEPAADDDGVFSFAAHTARADRAPLPSQSTSEPTPRTFDAEPLCAHCHGEHDGRDASLVAVADRRCQSCHAGTDFDRGHPEFAFASQPDGDDASIAFAHGQHVREILKRTGGDQPQRTCLRCHQPTGDGRGFQPIDYDRHCAECHLGAGVAVGRVPLAASDDGNDEGDRPGVWSLARIRASGLPATDWAFYVDPTEFRTAGGRVTKLRLEHEDPWILFNLRRLRQQRYGDAGVAELLVATPGDRPAAALYGEAVAALESQAAALRGSSDPAVQAELAWIEEELQRVRGALTDAPDQLAGPTSPAESSVPTADPPADRLEAWDELVAELAAPCITCHRMDRATLVRVEPDQRVLRSAEFDHGPHVIQRGCLDCHGRLPILEALDTENLNTDDLASLDDHAGIHNLPRIATCRECHGDGRVASACVDCHTFHPRSARPQTAPFLSASLPSAAEVRP